MTSIGIRLDGTQLTVRTKVVLGKVGALGGSLVKDPEIVEIVGIFGGRGFSTKIHIKDGIPGRRGDGELLVIPRSVLRPIQMIIVVIEWLPGRCRADNWRQRSGR